MTTAVAAPPAVAGLILVRMALPNATPKKVRDDVGKLLAAELSAAEFDQLRSELTAAGLLAHGKRSTFTLTDAGRERARQFLDVTELPPRANWGTVVAKFLFPKAAHLPADAAAKLDSGDKLAAHLLKRKYDLPANAGTTVKQVLEALLCKELGHPEETTIDGLMSAVLSRLVGADVRLTKPQLAKQLPLFGTGLTGSTADMIRRALIRDWLSGPAAEPVLVEPALAEPFDLPAFAATVTALAGRSPPADRFHDNKVFIAALWRASQREPAFPRLTLDEFKQRLVEANGRQLLHLSRADLVQAMDPRLVADSETSHLNSTFHFVLVEGGRP
jgi:uncharacterized protein (DUF2267 family)